MNEAPGKRHLCSPENWLPHNPMELSPPSLIFPIRVAMFIHFQFFRYSTFSKKAIGQGGEATYFPPGVPNVPWLGRSLGRGTCPGWDSPWEPCRACDGSSLGEPRRGVVCGAGSARYFDLPWIHRTELRVEPSKQTIPE